MLKGFFDKFKKKQEEEPLQPPEAGRQEQPTDMQPPKEPITEDVPLIQMDVPPISEEAIPGAKLPPTVEQAEAEATPAEQPAAPDNTICGADETEEASGGEETTEQAPIGEETEETSAEAAEEAPAEETTDAACAEKAVEEASAEEQQAGDGKKGFFAKLRDGLTKTRSAIIDRVDDVLSSFKSIDDELFDELEEALIMADIGVDTSLYIIERLREEAKAQGVKEAHALRAVLKDIIQDILTEQDCSMNLSHQPSVIMVIGVNGVGKTTSIGKLAHRYQAEGKKVILAAGDTFRAAAIDQLQIWADRAGVDIVKHTEGSDPSAVVFDAVQAAKARGADMVICDTAGRLHNKKNLMEELKKTARVIERELGHPPNEVLLVLDASTGQNALVQAKEFAQVAGITGVILTKLDGTAKGGVVIALSREQGIGVKFVGVGEQMDDMQPFDPLQFAQALFPDAGTDETK